MITVEEIKEYWVKNLKKYDYYEVNYDEEEYVYKTEKGFAERWIYQGLFKQWFGYADKLYIIIGGGRRFVMMPFGKSVFLYIRMGLSDGKLLAYSCVKDMDDLK